MDGFGLRTPFIFWSSTLRESGNADDPDENDDEGVPTRDDHDFIELGGGGNVYAYAYALCYMIHTLV